MTNVFRLAVVKLTAVFLAIVMTITICFSVVFYNLAVQELQTGFHNQYVRWLTEYQPYGLRQPGNPAEELSARSHHIYLQIVYFNIVILGVTGVASYLLAKRVLRPIERAHNLQKRFTADVSHELRTPLTALKMDTEVTLLDKKAPIKQLRQTLEGNLAEADRMETLVNNLLQLASLEEDQIRTDFEKINIADNVAAAIQVVEKLANSKKISLKQDIQPGYIIGDRSSITQLILILLENAIKYSPMGSIVALKTTKLQQTIQVSITDTGVGISAEALPHVFDRFYRADTSRNERKTHGFGLGLSLAKLIADLHHAEIVMTSAAGQGTQAVINFPAAAKK